MMSSACFSGTASSLSVIGPPVMRSTLTMRVLPTLAHSVRICRTVTSCASSDTRPSRTESVRGSAHDGVAEDVNINSASASLVIFRRKIYCKSGPLRAEIFNHSGDDLVELHFRLVPDEPRDFREVRYAPRHVFKSCFIGLV